MTPFDFLSEPFIEVHMIDVTDEEKKFLGFHLACQLEDYEKSIRKSANKGHDMKLAWEQWRRLEQLIYTKFIPESWCGPKPNYWK